jgi:hypothetical protein
MKQSNIFKLILISSILFGILIFGSCRSTAPEEAEPIYPMLVDNNANNINDYAEQSTHDPGPGEVSSKNSFGKEYSPHGESGHSFTDDNDDGICDYAQDGSPSWHGPGFIDSNDNGICDYWDESMPMHQQHEGMRFHDDNDNHINDYVEDETHRGEGHDFLDEDEDGICDFAQDGSPTWHGPGFTDSNQNGTCDYWEEGGRGHGRGHGMGGGNH